MAGRSDRAQALDELRALCVVDIAEPHRKHDEQSLALRVQGPGDLQKVTCGGIIANPHRASVRRRLASLSFLQVPLVRDTSPPAFLEGLKAEAGRKLTSEEAEKTQRWAGLLQNAMQYARALTQSGVLLTAGTDAPYPGDMQGEGLHRELELLVEEAISIATQNAARFIGANDWGTIEPGKVATLLIVDGRPDRDISHSRRVVGVYVAGKQIDRDSLKLSLQNDPGFQPISPVDF